MSVTYLYEDLSKRQTEAVEEYLLAAPAKADAVVRQEDAKDELVDLFGGDAVIVINPKKRITITTSLRDTINWREAFVRLAMLTEADESVQKRASNGTTNSVEQITVRITEEKRARREVRE